MISILHRFVEIRGVSFLAILRRIEATASGQIGVYHQCQLSDFKNAIL